MADDVYRGLLVYGVTGNPIPVTIVSGAATGDPDEYEVVPAGSADVSLGAAGAVGDYLSHLIIVPATDTCGAVSIKDGAGAAISIFVGGGTVALPTLAPITVPIGLTSLAGAWKVTTGANVSVVAAGAFT